MKFTSNKIRQILFDMRHQSVITWVTFVGTALAIFLIMTVVTVQQLNVMPFAPESNRNRLMYGLNMHIAQIERPDNNSSARLSYWAVNKLYGGLDGVELMSVMKTDTDMVDLEGTTDNPISAESRSVDSNFWRIFDHKLLDGRYFDETEVNDGVKVAVMTESTARKLFGGIDAVGKEFTINYNSFRLVGIVADHSRLARQASADVFIPVLPDEKPWDPGVMYEMLGSMSAALLLQEGTTQEQLQKQVKARYAELDTKLAPEGLQSVYHEQPYDVETVNAGDIFSNGTPEIESERRKRLVAYMALLLLPAINLSSMLHSRIRRRVSEFGVRRAFGCTRTRIFRDIISENFLITIAGGLVGWACSIIFALNYDGLYIDMWGGSTGAPQLAMLLNWRFIAIIFTLCFILNIISASIPAWVAARLKTVDAINGRNR